MASTSFIPVSTFAPPRFSVDKTSFLSPSTVGHPFPPLVQPKIVSRPSVQNVPSPTKVPHALFGWGSAYKASGVTEFSTMTESQPVMPPLRATVVSVSPISLSDDYMELVIDVSQSGIYEAHTAPGQTLRLGRPDAKRQESTAAVICSPPQSGPLLRFMIFSKADPCELLQCKQGDEIATGEISGKGIDFMTAAEAKKNLYMFVDSPQAYAAVHSLIEWPAFRAMTGTGANRTTYLTVYYSLPKAKAIPYSHCFSKWSVFGVNIIPIMGQSLLEYLSVQSSLGRGIDAVGSDYVIAAVQQEKTYEALFSALILLGFRRLSISKFTEDVVAKYDSVRGKSKRKIRREGSDAQFDQQGRGMPDDVYAEKVRQKVEREIWANWVDIREEMRVEFEQKWEEQARTDRKNKRTEAERRQAWESWSARNTEQWTDVKWDDQAWKDYWHTWYTAEEEAKQRRSNERQTGAYYQNSGSERTWNQQNSTEYWDWAGRGSDAKGGGPAKGRQENSSWWAYSDHSGQPAGGGGAGGGGSNWGNSNNKQWSGYNRGYRYEYDEGRDGKKGQKGRGHGKEEYNSSGSSGSESGSWKGWQNRSRAQNGKSGGSSNRSSRGGSASSSSATIDLYGVLGIGSGASRDEIKKAYRREAMEHHPDRNPTRVKEAHVKMKQIVVAWTVLKDTGSRQKYDAYGVGGF